MSDALLRNLLHHLSSDPALVAITAFEVAELRTLGYVVQRGLRLTDAGRAKLAELEGQA